MAHMEAGIFLHRHCHNSLSSYSVAKAQEQQINKHEAAAKRGSRKIAGRRRRQSRVNTSSGLLFYLFVVAVLLLNQQYSHAQQPTSLVSPQTSTLPTTSAVGSLNHNNSPTTIIASTPPSSSSSSSLVCNAGEHIGFTILPGAILLSDAKIQQFNTLDIGACIDACRSDEKCLSANFETGLCSYSAQSSVTSPEALRTDDFPVFPTYIEKICLALPTECKIPWQLERVLKHQMPLAIVGSKSIQAANVRECMNACLAERSFLCRSAQFESGTNQCTLFTTSRQMEQMQLVQPEPPTRQVEYFDNACAPEPRAYCEFNRIRGRVLKATDVVRYGVKSEDECRQMCIDAPFPCQYYHYAVLSIEKDDCSISHHTSLTLAHIVEPYVFDERFVSYEVRGCFDVKLECQAKSMIARINTNRVFDGMVYARSKPKTCYFDVNNATDFQLAMPLDGSRCDTEYDGNGNFSNFIMIQNHKSIVTSRDMGLSVQCEYDLRPRNITSSIGTVGQPSITENVMSKVPAPIVEMSIRDMRGDRIDSATVGEKVYLQFDLLTQKNVIAMDVLQQSNLKLIDADGCPADDVVLGAVESLNGGNTVRIAIEVFKFPFNDEVQYVALVKPCQTKCEAVHCVNKKISDIAYLSYGRRRRKRALLTPDNDDAGNATADLSSTLPIGSPDDELMVSQNNVRRGGHRRLVKTATTTTAKPPGSVAKAADGANIDELLLEQQRSKSDVYLTQSRMHVRDRFVQCAPGTVGCDSDEDKKTKKRLSRQRDDENSLLPDTTSDATSAQSSTAYVCIHRVGIAIGCSGLVLLQTIFIAILVFIYRRYNSRSGGTAFSSSKIAPAVDLSSSRSSSAGVTTNPKTAGDASSYGGYRQAFASVLYTPWTLAKRQQHTRPHAQEQQQDDQVGARSKPSSRQHHHHHHRHRADRHGGRSASGERRSATRPAAEANTTAKYDMYPHVSTAVTTTTTTTADRNDSHVNYTTTAGAMPPLRGLKWFTLRRSPIVEP